MLHLLRTRIDRLKGLLSEVGIPMQVLSAVDAAPVPVGVHYNADELGVIDVRELGVFAGAAGLERIGRSGGRDVGGYQREEDGELHVGWMGVGGQGQPPEDMMRSRAVALL